MKRFVSPVILIVALIVAAGFTAQVALADQVQDQATVTVTVPSYILIDDLDAVNVSVTFSGGPPPTGSGSGSDPNDFYVYTNGTGVSVTPSVTTAPVQGATLLGGTVTPTTPAVGTPTYPGSGEYELNVNVSGIDLTKPTGNYVGEITVTVIYTP